ncbi:hypothetical protein ACWC9Q_37555 [Streptomyces sp. NPDC001142]
MRQTRLAGAWMTMARRVITGAVSSIVTDWGAMWTAPMAAARSPEAA